MQFTYLAKSSLNPVKPVPLIVATCDQRLLEPVNLVLSILAKFNFLQKTTDIIGVE